MNSALLGAACHYFIAFSIVIVYWLAARWLPVLTRHAVICGIVYGILVYVCHELRRHPAVERRAAEDASICCGFRAA